MLVDIGLKFYTVSSRPTWVTLRSRSRTWKFCVKVFGYFYMSVSLILCMLVDIGLNGRYWSEVLCCTVVTHLSDLEFKVTDLEILC